MIDHVCMDAKFDDFAKRDGWKNRWTDRQMDRHTGLLGCDWRIKRQKRWYTFVTHFEYSPFLIVTGMGTEPSRKRAKTRNWGWRWSWSMDAHLPFRPQTCTLCRYVATTNSKTRKSQSTRTMRHLPQLVPELLQCLVQSVLWAHSPKNCCKNSMTIAHSSKQFGISHRIGNWISHTHFFYKHTFYKHTQAQTAKKLST